MNDKQIIEYVRNMIKTNLQQSLQDGTGGTKVLIAEIYNLNNDEDNKVLLEHIKGVKALLEKAEQIIKQEKD